MQKPVIHVSAVTDHSLVGFIFLGTYLIAVQKPQVFKNVGEFLRFGIKSAQQVTIE